jgi:hypothetical protein
MIRVLEFVMFAALLLILTTEILYPLITNKPLFGSFRAQGKTTPKSGETLATKVSNAKEKIKEVKEVQQEVDNNFKSAEQLKEESDNLLNKE